MHQKITYVTISIGGSIINPGKIDKAFLQEFRNLVIDFVEKSEGQKKLIIVCGGGATAREYINAAPPDLPPGQKDYLGIAPTWINAQLLTAWLHEFCANFLLPGYMNFVLQFPHKIFDNSWIMCNYILLL
ncbi:MAG: amino acid kinase family protein [Candidatus Hodarchaeales archaeon]